MNPLESALSVIDTKTQNSLDMGLMRAKARGLMVGYDRRWREQEYITVAVEDVVTADLYNPETGAKSRTFTIAGKLDVRADLNGLTVLVDHKTTSEDITDPNGTYWRQLIVENQLSHYLLLEWLNGRKPNNAMWDVIRKPSISPRQLTKAEQKEISFQKKWFGFDLTDEQVQEAIASGRETMRLYELRLTSDCTAERPERYFQRRSIPRLDSEIMEYAKELWDHSQDLIVARRTNRHPKNAGACLLYGSPCVFLGVCSGHDEIDSGNWRKKEWAHNELPVLSDKTGAEILTNSRVRGWQTCRRKHQYQYEIGVERVEPEDKESLVFGTLIHEALAAWWECFNPNQTGEENGNSNSAQANEVRVA